MKKYILIIALFLILTACSNAVKENSENDKLDNEPRTGSNSVISFTSLDEWWTYEFDSSSRGVDSDSINTNIQERRFLLPVLPDEYGKNIIVREESGGILFQYHDESAPRIRELIELYSDLFMYVSISHREKDSEWTLDDVVQTRHETFNKSTRSSTIKDEIRFEYLFWSGLNIYDEPSSFSHIMALYEDEYFIFIRLPFGDEESILTFIDELSFETYTIRDATQIAEVAAEARGEASRREAAEARRAE